MKIIYFQRNNEDKHTEALKAGDGLATKPATLAFARQ